MNSWPFDQPRGCAVLVTREVLNRGEPILHVTHDADDHGWQLSGFSDGTVENGRVISMQEALELDSICFAARRFAGWLARCSRFA